MYKHYHERSIGASHSPKKFESLKFALIDLEEYSFNIHGLQLNVESIWAFFTGHCLDCLYLHEKLGKTFFNESILNNYSVPLGDKIIWLQPCFQLMLTFSAISNFFGRNAVLKSCEFIVGNWEILYPLRYWGCQTTFGFCNHFALEHYFRDAMNIGYTQKVEQWANFE